MKPLHIGLLAAGAMLAGGLAFEMTQPPVVPLPVAASPVPSPAPAAKVVPAPPPVTIPQPPKPSPIPPLARAAAPDPVYAELPKSQPSKPPAPRSRPVVIASARPTQWLPGRYEAPPAPSAPPASNSGTAPRQVTLHPGMAIPVRLDESLSTERNVAGDVFQASLAEPLVVDNLVIAERGARVTGRILDAQKSGRLGLALSTVATSDGQRVLISTEPWTKQVDASAGEDAAKVGGGAALGAIIGAIAGGGKGAAIGAGIGGGAGTVAAVATHGKPVNLPSETVIRFRLSQRITVTEQPVSR